MANHLTLRWGDYPRLSPWAQCNHKGKGGREGEQSGVICKRPPWPSRAFKMEGSTSQVGRGETINSPPQSAEGTQTCRGPVPFLPLTLDCPTLFRFLVLRMWDLSPFLPCLPPSLEGLFFFFFFIKLITS